MEENMSPKEMLERIAELNYSQNQLKGLNAEMRQLLDAADEEIALLRSENATLRQKVQSLEKFMRNALEDEEETGRDFTYDLDVNKCNEKKIHKLEKDYDMLREQNQKLTAEHEILQQENGNYQITLNDLRKATQTFKFDFEEAQLELQQRDEALQQNNMQLRYMEETLEEFSSIIKDLRETNQELRMQLEDGKNKTSFGLLNELTEEQEESPAAPLSFAEEIKQLEQVETIGMFNTDSQNKETQELNTPQMLTTAVQTERCEQRVETPVLRAGLFRLCIFIFTLLVLMTSGGCIARLLFMNTFWEDTYLILQPYCNIKHMEMPPL